MECKEHVWSFLNRDAYAFEWNGNSFWVIEKCEECGKKVESEYTLVERKELMEDLKWIGF